MTNQLNIDAVKSAVLAAAKRSASPIRLSVSDAAIDAGLQVGQTYMTGKGRVRITTDAAELIGENGEVVRSIQRTVDSDGKLLAMIALNAGRVS